MASKTYFSRLTTFNGRNGMGKCSGIDLLKIGNDLTLSPLTSRGDVANCEICIPKENVPALIAALEKTAGITNQ